VNRKTGAEAVWGFIDKNTGEQLSTMDLAIEEGPGADHLMRWRLSHGEHRRHQHKVDDQAVSPGGAPPVRATNHETRGARKSAGKEKRTRNVNKGLTRTKARR
jgi:hypothetical protein